MPWGSCLNHDLGTVSGYGRMCGMLHFGYKNGIDISISLSKSKFADDLHDASLL